MMKTNPLTYYWSKGMSLVEVALALGLVSFCVVALLGLFPIILNGIRESRENLVSSRILYAVEQDLLERSPQAGSPSREYFFDREGFPDNAQDAFFKATAESDFHPSLPGNMLNESLVLSKVALINRIENSTNLQRPIWTVLAPEQ